MQVAIKRGPVLLAAVTLSAAAMADTGDRRLNGSWRADLGITLADIAASNTPSDSSSNGLSTEFFGQMIHGWTCSKLRAWVDCQQPAEPVPCRITQRTADAVVAHKPDDPNADMELTFEGDCYVAFHEASGFNDCLCRTDRQ
jgi:hypothetical protein